MKVIKTPYQSLEEMDRLYAYLVDEEGTPVCFWKGKAGMPEEVGKYGIRPGATSGNYQRHLDGCLGFAEYKKMGYSVQVAGQPRGGIERAPLQLTMHPLHDCSG